ncbi:LytTR family DNA-binding domain-containing protein [Lewinella sp. 4G2]|uniref:LytR/AlgR family response regulator transcription factor n=1 Tax=Lewinella sp. 4G2 TaxID=1803372 RepID=UPI0007B4F54C|nr:LytTR family DNA-binding domain-containing protein [Lewinella sp. 4G2]OAV44415.1 hypothetical protein A3850_007870 [Lewinella sp. 4G2]
MINAILIDDEPAANRSLNAMLERYHPEVVVKGTAVDVASGLKAIKQINPDLLFLDINMPDGSGIDLIRGLDPGNRPEVIFVTSEVNYSMQAVKVAALGYLVKPVDKSELKISLEIAKVRIEQRNSEARLRALLSNADGDNYAAKQISIPSDNGVEFVTAGEILYCSGLEGYTNIHLSDGTKRLSSYSLGEYRKMLEPFGFFVVHRSHLVNRAQVRGLARGGDLVLKNGEQVAISRRRKEAVLQWIKNG